MTLLEELATVHNRLQGLPQLTPVRVRIERAEVPANLAGKPGWARLAGRVVWTGLGSNVPGNEVLAGEWVEGGASFRLRFGPSDRSVVRIEEVTAGGTEMLREEVHVMARGFAGKQPATRLRYHVYWGLDEVGAIDRMFDAFMGLVEAAP